MNFRRFAAVAAFSLAAATASCAALYHGPAGGRDAEMAPDSTTMAVLVDNQNDEAVRVFVVRGANGGWIGTVSPMTSQTLQIPADIPGGGGGITFRVLTIGGLEWDARGIVPRGGSTIRLEIAREIRLSNWSMR